MLWQVESTRFGLAELDWKDLPPGPHKIIGYRMCQILPQIKKMKP